MNTDPLALRRILNRSGARWAFRQTHAAVMGTEIEVSPMRSQHGGWVAVLVGAEAQAVSWAPEQDRAVQQCIDTAVRSGLLVSELAGHALPVREVRP